MANYFCVLSFCDSCALWQFCFVHSFSLSLDMEINKTQKGRDMPVLDGYSCLQEKKGVNGKLIWKCYKLNYYCCIRPTIPTLPSRLLKCSAILLACDILCGDLLCATFCEQPFVRDLLCATLLIPKC